MPSLENMFLPAAPAVPNLSKGPTTRTKKCEAKDHRATSNVDPKHTFDKKGDWSAMTAARWHDSLYYEGSFFWKLFQDTQIYIKRAATIYCGAPSRCMHVEVGCGTGDVILSMAANFKRSIGVDINSAFLTYAKAQALKNVGSDVWFCEGSATDLVDLVEAHAPGTVSERRVVVSCVNNTLGVFPDLIKPRVYQQMKDLAGEFGIIVVGFWNGNRFGEALQHFYDNQPDLCGSLKDAKIDFKGHYLATAEGYHTHWTTPEEARQVLKKNGFNVLDITETGVGVLCTCSGGRRDINPTADITPNHVDSGMLQAAAAAAAAATEEPRQSPAEVEAPSINHYEDSFSQYAYLELWGGYHQHVGLYDEPGIVSLPPAQRVVQACEDSTSLLFALSKPPLGARMVDFGSGFGNTARYAALTFGARVECIDLCRSANERNRELTRRAGLGELVQVRADATSFFATGLPSGSFDLCLAEDSLCHAGDQSLKALQEAARLLAPGGILAVTNILREPEAAHEELEDILPRVQLSTMESTESFITKALQAGFELAVSMDKTPSMALHFGTLVEVLECRKEEIQRNTSIAYVEELHKDLTNWTAAATNGMLRWAYYIFHKRTS